MCGKRVTPEMAEAGGWAHAWCRMHGVDEAPEHLATASQWDAVSARIIFNVMASVESGQLDASLVENLVCPKIGLPFFLRFL